MGRTWLSAMAVAVPSSRPCTHEAVVILWAPHVGALSVRKFNPVRVAVVPSRDHLSVAPGKSIK